MTVSQIILTVSQLTSAIKLHLENQFPSIVVQGEVSNFKRQSSGHLYFTLKDAHAQISCAMFQANARLLSELPKEGDQVQIRGEINVYPPRGNYQIIVRSLQKAGVGALLQLLEERKQKYMKLGYFDLDYKKKLPSFPKTIGIVTSPTGAVISDILQILNRRAYGFHVLLNPVKVQGEGAAEEIGRAIDDFNQYNLADVIIVGRGGGSIEDLWAFNEERVVESVYRSKIPIISAVGHETDTTLCDLAADVRAPTPSAAAELVLEQKEVYESFIENLRQRIDLAMQNVIQLRKEKLGSYLHHPFLVSPESLLRIFQQKIDESQMILDQAVSKRIAIAKEFLHHLMLSFQAQNPALKIQKKIFLLGQISEKLNFKMETLIQSKKNSFDNLVTHLMAINPKKVLDKGYSILFDEKKNCAIVNVKDIALKQKLKLILKDGSVQTTVDHITPSEDGIKRNKL